MSVVWIWCTAREREPFNLVGACWSCSSQSHAVHLWGFFNQSFGREALIICVQDYVYKVMAGPGPWVCSWNMFSKWTCSLNGHALAHSLSLSLPPSLSLSPSLPRSLSLSLALSLSLWLSPSLEFSQDWAGPGESSICAMLQSCKTWICVAGGACNRPMQVESHVPWVYECKIPWRGQPQRKLAPDLFKNSLLIPAWKTSFFDRFFATMGPDRFRPSTLPQCIYVCVSIRMRVCILVSSVGVGSVGWVVGRLVFKKLVSCLPGLVCLLARLVDWLMSLCVWNIWIDVKPPLKQGVDAWSGSHPPTKTLPFHGDMTKGRLCHVPASFSDMGCGQPKNHHAVSK